jgi:hypothetical protein
MKRWRALLSLGLGLCYVSTAWATSDLQSSEFVRLRHAGDEDHPVPSIVLSPREIAREEKAEWTNYFVVSRRAFNSAALYVANARGRHASVIEEPPRRGTFEVTWKTTTSSGRYFVLPKDSCAFMDELAKAAIRRDAAATKSLEGLQETKRYVECPRR